MASYFSRIWLMWKGWLGLGISGLEASNPEAVFEAAIDERIKKHRELKKAVSGIVYLRNKLQTEIDTKEKELKDVNIQLPIAVESGEDEAALILIQKKEQLEGDIVETRIELGKVSSQAEDAKKGLLEFQAEINKLKREKVEMLAKKANAEARITIQETLDGLSTDADIKALDNVRESIHKLDAEADIGGELQGDSLDQKLSEIRAKAKDASAQMKLDKLKKEMAAKKQAAKVEKTI